MGRAAGDPPPSSTYFKNEWRYTPTPPYAFIACTRTDSPLGKLHSCTFSEVLEERVRLLMQQASLTSEFHSEFWSKKLNTHDYLRGLVIRWVIILKLIVT